MTIGAILLLLGLILGILTITTVLVFGYLSIFLALDAFKEEDE